MKKQTFLWNFLSLVLALVTCFSSCSSEQVEKLKKIEGVTFSDEIVEFDGKEHSIFCKGIPEGATVVYTGNKGTVDGVYPATATISKSGYESLELHAKLTIVLTAPAVIQAKDELMENKVQNYDFKINLSGNLAVSGFAGEANANYDGQYRYNAETDHLLFKRTTSGVLLYDSTEYIYNSGTSKIKIVENEDGEVKRVSVLQKEEQELKLLNIPFLAVIRHLKNDNLEKIQKSEIAPYQYKTRITLASDSPCLQTFMNALKMLGISIEIKDVSFTNPAGGIDFYFNLNNNRTELTDFKYSVSVSFPVKFVNTTFQLTYEQKADSDTIKLPAMDSIMADSGKIRSEMEAINGELCALKNFETYSLDLKATNEVDPGWNTRAVTDRYYARLFKNTCDDGRIDFNQSFEYKSHTEEEGAETFKYTYGNLRDGSVFLISRKGKNTVKEADGITADHLFDAMIGAGILAPEHIECIKKEEKDNKTILHIFMDDESKIDIQRKILEMINSNKAEGVTDVDNYFDKNNYMAEDASVIIEKENNQIVSIKIETKFRYFPVSGDYTEEKVTLTNTLELSVNDLIEKAKKYEAPKNADSSFGNAGLKSASYYIL